MFKAHRLLFHSTLGSRMIKKKKGYLQEMSVKSAARLTHLDTNLICKHLSFISLISIKIAARLL